MSVIEFFFLHRRSSYSCLLNRSSAQYAVKAYGGSIVLCHGRFFEYFRMWFHSPSVDIRLCLYLFLFVVFALSFHFSVVCISSNYYGNNNVRSFGGYLPHWAWLKENETITSQCGMAGIVVAGSRNVRQHIASHTRCMHEHNAKQWVTIFNRKGSSRGMKIIKSTANMMFASAASWKRMCEHHWVYENLHITME